MTTITTRRKILAGAATLQLLPAAPPLPCRSRCRCCRSRPSPRPPILSGNFAGDLDGTLRRSSLPVNDGCWHKADVQPLAVLGPLTGA